MYQIVYQENKYCTLFTLKDVVCILTYAPGSVVCQPWENYVFRGRSSPSSLMFMHYILEYSKGRNLAGSWSLGFGFLPCRSHLITANLKVLAMTPCLENGKEVPCVHVCHGFKWYHFTSFLECFVWSKWEFGESGTAREEALRNREWRCHLIALKLRGVVVPVSLFRD